MAATSTYHYAPPQYPSYASYYPSFHRSPATFYTMSSYQQQEAPLSRLAQSRSKADFFRHLGWNERSEEHKRLYHAMKEEASKARHALTNDRNNLVAEAAADPRIQAPFSSSQMTETALWQEVRRIWEGASPETKRIYDKGAFMESGNQDNWIIRWVLWHVFRYRDLRNRNRNTSGRAERASSASSAGSPTSPEAPTFARVVFDPVRDAHASNGSALMR